MKANVRTLTVRKTADILNVILKDEHSEIDEATDADADALEGGAAALATPALAAGATAVQKGRGVCARKLDFAAHTMVDDWYEPPSADNKPRELRSFLLDRFGLVWPLRASGTVQRLMHHPLVGAEYGEYERSYYVDGHEKHPKYRKRFLEDDAKIELLEHKW